MDAVLGRVSGIEDIPQTIVVADIDIWPGADLFIPVQFKRIDERVDGIEKEAQYIHERHFVISLLVGGEQPDALLLLLVLLFFCLDGLLGCGGNVVSHQIFSWILRFISASTSSIVMEEVSMSTASSALLSGARAREESCSSRRTISLSSSSLST